MPEEKKLLYISYYFAPQNKIGAVRPTKQVKYLIKKGWMITVITSLPDINENTDSGNQYSEIDKAEIIRINKGALSRITHALLGLVSKTRETQKSSIQNTKNTPEPHNNVQVRKFPSITEIVNYLDSISWSYQVKKTIRKQLKGRRYDTIVSTYGPISSHWLGMYAKNKGLADKWFADFRDLMVNFRLSQINNRFMAHWQLKFCRFCDGIITVSRGMAETLASFLYDNGIKDKQPVIISSGFDIDDYTRSKTCEKSSSELIFVYTGQLYGGNRDISPIFYALSELFKEGTIDKNKIRFVYAGSDGSELIRQAGRYGLSDMVADKGRLKRQDALSLQASSHILVLASWNSVMEKGIVTGKLYEYMASERPVIAVIKGDIADSELKSVINDTNIGFAYEEAHHHTDFSLLKEYIRMQYDATISAGSPVYSPDKTKISEYDYNTLADKLEKVLLSL